MCWLVATTAWASTGEAVADSDSAAWRVSIDEVVVTGVRGQTDARLSPFTVSQIGRTQIEEQLAPSLLDVVSEHVPGVFTTSRGMLGYGVSTGAAGQMNIRGIGGAPTTGVLVLVDGHPQQMGIMGHPISDAYQSMIAEKVEVLRGPASMLYGSAALGGVINIVTRQMRHDGVETSANAAFGSYATLTTELANRFRKGRLSTVATLSYNRTDGHRANSAFEQMSGYLKIGYQLSDHWNAAADLNLTHFNASNPGSIYKPMIDNDQHITRGMASLNVTNRYGTTWGGISIFHNWGRHKINDGYSEGDSPKEYLFRSRDHISGANLYQSASLFSGNTITVGTDLQWIGGKAWNAYSDRDAVLVDTTLTEVAAYAEMRQQLWQWLSLEAGVRVDHHSVAGTEWIPQFGAAMRLNDVTNVKLTVGKGFRNPTLMNLFMFRAKNPDLKAERIWNYEAALSGRLADGRLGYGVNVYYLKGDNMIQTVGGQNVNTGEIENIGVELQADVEINKHWKANTNYSYIHAEHLVVATPKHRWFGEIEYHGSAWTIGTSLDWINHLTTQVEPYEQSSYVLLNARVAYQVAKPVTLYVKGENLLAQRYEINYGFTMPRATVMAGVKCRF